MADAVTEPSGHRPSLAGPQSPLTIDRAGREAYWKAERLDLSSTEVALLACLHRRLGQTVTYDALLREVWGTALGQGGSLWQVRSAVKRLREKLAAAGAQACRIVAVRRRGYRLELYPADRSRRAYRHRVALRVGLLLIVAALLGAFAAGWLLAKQDRGDPTALVWYRQQRVHAGLLWALGRGQHCAEGPDGELYCFDTPEERAAAIDLLLRNAAPEGQDRPSPPAATPFPQPRSE